jgi:hypothetical protein
MSASINPVPRYRVKQEARLDLEVKVPAGTHAAAVDSALNAGELVTSGYTEQELLLGRQYGIKLLNEDVVGGVEIVHAEVVSPTGRR